MGFGRSFTWQRPENTNWFQSVSFFENDLHVNYKNVVYKSIGT